MSEKVIAPDVHRSYDGGGMARAADPRSDAAEPREGLKRCAGG